MPPAQYYLQWRARVCAEGHTCFALNDRSFPGRVPKKCPGEDRGMGFEGLATALESPRLHLGCDGLVSGEFPLLSGRFTETTNREHRRNIIRETTLRGFEKSGDSGVPCC